MSMYPDFVCYLYGATSDNVYQVEYLREMIERLGLQERVFIRASVLQDKLFQTLVDADVLVVPRRLSVVTRAGFSQKFGDYLLSGVPVVSTEVGEIVNFLQSGREILFTPEGDAKAFAEAIYYLFSHPEKARQIGMNGRKFAIEHFDYRALGKRLENLLDAGCAEY